MSHKNLKRYYQAWELRQQGKKLREIGEIMGFSADRARVLVDYVNFRLNSKFPPLTKELRILRSKYFLNGV